jgi:hypothetical protein
MTKSKAVFGIFKSKPQVENAVEELQSAGFMSSDISVLLPSTEGAQNLKTTKESKAPEGAATGAGTGAVIGGALGLLAGIGALAIPGIGPFIAAGPIMGALAGAGLGGAVGGITGALIGLGVPEFEAKRYEGYLKSGGFLVSVHTDSADEVKRAEEVMERCGAEDVAATGETKESWTQFKKGDDNIFGRTGS